MTNRVLWEPWSGHYTALPSLPFAVLMWDKQGDYPGCQIALICDLKKKKKDLVSKSLYMMKRGHLKFLLQASRNRTESWW